jgi:hypothetical protein
MENLMPLFSLVSVTERFYFRLSCPVDQQIASRQSSTLFGIEHLRVAVGDIHHCLDSVEV